MNLLETFMLFRARDAGVHCGIVLAISQDGKTVDVKDCRRIWKWEQAFSLNEIAVHGCGEASRISEPVPFNQLSDVIEKLACSDKARKNLERSRNGSK
jgi:hypothetical protein